MSYEQFMDSTFYFYFGLFQQWLLSNGANRREVEATTPEKQERKILTFDQLPDGYW
ncbi:MAG: hypothetical protein FWB91_01970 [Defluviitaleaceae bacterium]|nr:hypothetical protein [Defluviitaleaceae bacterium]